MARVGDEATLALERVSEPPEHVVERHAQATDLVAGRREGEPPVGLSRRNLLCLDPHRVDRPESCRRERVAEERREEQGDRRDEEEYEHEAVHRLVAIVERRADDEDAWAGPRRDEPRRHANRVREPGDVVDRDERPRRREQPRLSRRENWRRPDLPRLPDDDAVLVEHLGEARLPGRASR